MRHRYSISEVFMLSEAEFYRRFIQSQRINDGSQHPSCWAEQQDAFQTNSN